MERFRTTSWIFLALVPKSKSIENSSWSLTAPSGDKTSGFWETPFCGFVYNINIDSGLYSESGIHRLKPVGHRNRLIFFDRIRLFVDPCSGLKAVVVVIEVVKAAVGISVVEPRFISVVSSEVNCSVVELVCLEVWAVEDAVVINVDDSTVGRVWDDVDNGAVVVDSDVVVGLQK